MQEEFTKKVHDVKAPAKDAMTPTAPHAKSVTRMSTELSAMDKKANVPRETTRSCHE